MYMSVYKQPVCCFKPHLSYLSAFRKNEEPSKWFVAATGVRADDRRRSKLTSSDGDLL